MDKIKYTKGFKYQVAETFEVELVGCPAIPDRSWINGRVTNKLAHLSNRDGRIFLVLHQFYSWDGATWALDSKNFRRGSAAHDALLELIGVGLLPYEVWKPWTDKFLIKLCKEDRMWWPRRKWVHRAVSKLGDPMGSDPREVFTAP